MTRLRIGMIGAGFIGQLAHLMNFIEVRECEIVALADLRPKLRQKVAARYGIPRTYATHRELLIDAAVQAVVVVTPRPYTARVVLDCLKAGKHVLSEKPMACTVEQAEELVATAASSGLHYAVGYMKRYDEGVQKAKQILDGLTASEELGPISFARAHCFMGESYCRADGHLVTDEKPEYPDQGLPIAPKDFPEDLSRDYAFYLNTYSHNTNLLRYLLRGIPNVVCTRFARQEGRLAVLDFGKFVATLETGRVSDRGWDEITEVYFPDGRLTIRTPPALLKNVPAKVELYRAGDTQVVERPCADWPWAFRSQAEAFVHDVLEGRESLISGRDALEDMKLIDRMWRQEADRLGYARKG